MRKDWKRMKNVNRGESPEDDVQSSDNGNEVGDDSVI